MGIKKIIKIQVSFTLLWLTPEAKQVKIIAYTIINEKIFAYSSDVKILKGQKLTLNLKEINEKDFEKIIMK